MGGRVGTFTRGLLRVEAGGSGRVLVEALHFGDVDNSGGHRRLSLATGVVIHIYRFNIRLNMCHDFQSLGS